MATSHNPDTPIVTLPPPVEALFDTPEPPHAWPASCHQHPSFISQIAARRTLVDAFDAILDALPRLDTPWHRAVATGALDAARLTHFYERFADTLLADPESHRVVLYAPLECFPARDDRSAAASAFRAAFMWAWRGLLGVHDVRANFVDGDVMEVELRDGDLPRVVKAAHLTPALVNAGMLSMDEVTRLLTTTGDPLLVESLTDTLSTLDRDGHITQTHRAALTTPQHLDATPPTPARRDLTLKSLPRALEDGLRAIDHAPRAPGVTDKRAAWLREVALEQLIDTLSDQAHTLILAGQHVGDVMMTHGPTTQRTLIEALRKAILAEARGDSSSARRRHDTHRDALISLWRDADGPLRESLKQLWRHLHSVGVLSDDEIEDLGVTVPALAGPFRDNMPAMAPLLRDMAALVQRMRDDDLLSETVYPALITFGSRLKGYGHDQSDVDVAVFIRPETAMTRQSEVRARLSELLRHRFIHGPAFEFWTMESDDGALQIRDMDHYDPVCGESTWTHVILGGVWQGPAETLETLQGRLLPTFIQASRRQKYGVDIRDLYLEELERDTILYRLMHKGYARFRAPLGGLDGPGRRRMDGDSAFWDSGLRHVATRLYLSRVFLPKLPEASR